MNRPIARPPSPRGRGALRDAASRPELAAGPAPDLRAPRAEGAGTSPRPARVHLVGIGGIGMSALALHLRSLGFVVSGSDLQGGTSLEALRAAGCAIETGHAAAGLPANAEILVRTHAVDDDNPEVAAARARGLEIVSYSQALGRLCAARETAAVAGTHGKTTTAAILAHVLKASGRDPGAVIGGLVPQLGGNALLGEGEAFVVEACEYRESFLDLAPRHGIITNVDADHLDWYGSTDRLRAAFRRFGAGIDARGVLVTTSEVARDLDLRGAARCRLLALGPKKRDVRIVEDLGGFRVLHPDGDRSPRIRCLLPGRHNLANAALAAVAARKAFGIDYGAIAAAISGFAGISRRYEVLCETVDAVVVDDYAHHPTEIEATLLAARARHPGRRITAVFQPHLMSRTLAHFPGFLNALSIADRVGLVQDYHVAGRDGPEADGARRLHAALRRLGMAATFLGEVEEAASALEARRRRGDVIVVMGAGSVRDLAGELARRLR